MLEIHALGGRPALAPEPADHPAANSPNQSGTTQTASPGENTALPVPNYGNYLKPIDTPLVFNGFSNETLQRYAPQFAAAGIVPVMGIGSASDRRQPEPIEAGSPVTAVLVLGEMGCSATCIVAEIGMQPFLCYGSPPSLIV